MNGREWRVVVLNSDDEVTDCFGHFKDAATALRIGRTFADAGVVVQHQQPPTEHPWITIKEPA